MKRKTVLCKLNFEYCPTVEVLKGGKVRIGESPNFITLTSDQWNILVDKVRRGELSRI